MIKLTRNDCNCSYIETYSDCFRKEFNKKIQKIRHNGIVLDGFYGYVRNHMRQTFLLSDI